MPTVVMPVAASAAGEAFELLSSRYLTAVSGLTHVAAPFYTRLGRGRWVQFDGVFSRGGGELLVLEAKFHSMPVSLSTAGISARLLFAKEAGGAGVILTSRCGFARDVLRLKLPIEKVLLSWPGMRKGLRGSKGRWLTAALDEVTRQPWGFQASSGARLVWDDDRDLSGGEEGLAFVPAQVERWLRRLPVSPRDVEIGRTVCRFRRGGKLDIESAWAIEDSLRGFAPAHPNLLERALGVLSEGPAGIMEIWKSLWRRGYRGRESAVKNALDDLCVIGVARKAPSSRGLIYLPSKEHEPSRSPAEILERAVREWPAMKYFLAARTDGLSDKYALAAELSKAFSGFFPYARSLYNPAKVAGLMALARYFGS